LAGIGQGRLYNAAKAVGLARWGLERALNYAKDRVTFGKRLIDHQAVAFQLAEAAMEILPAHLLGLHAAEQLEQGRPALMETAMAKATSVEMSARVLEKAIQVLGGIGFTNELGLTQAWQEERIVHVADGSAEMQRRIIAGRLAAGDVDHL
jgi:acyl-CoA dehydrogenase